MKCRTEEEEKELQAEITDNEDFESTTFDHDEEANYNGFSSLESSYNY